jgi:hypothetical protein
MASSSPRKLRFYAMPTARRSVVSTASGAAFSVWRPIQNVQFDAPELAFGHGSGGREEADQTELAADDIPHYATTSSNADV